MIRKKAMAELDLWVEQAKASLITSFANGVARDRAAVSAAISSSWSNGQTEGQITKLKLVKRQMYGRAKIDLLQARLVDVYLTRLHQNCVRAPFPRRLTVHLFATPVLRPNAKAAD